MWCEFNPNPKGIRVGDCAVRAISKAMDIPWEEAYTELCVEGLLQSDLPSSNSVWGRYLRKHGFSKHIPHSDTLAELAIDNPKGTYVVALSGHVVTVKDGSYFDSWDSGSEVPLYYWRKDHVL